MLSHPPLTLFSIGLVACASSEVGNGFALGWAMGSAQSAALPATPWRPWPDSSRAEVAFLLGEQPAAERISQRLFGRVLDPNEYAGLAGAPDHATVEVGASDGKLYIEMRDPAAATRGYYYLYSKKAATVLLNDGFRIQVHAMQRCGLGLQVLHRQVHNAATLAVDRIETVAGRNDDENGYYTWPRYGFQAMLPASIRRFLPAGLDDSRTLLDVMASEKGRQWWKAHGVAIRVRFDLAPESRSRRVFAQYVGRRILGWDAPKHPVYSGSSSDASTR